MEVLLGREAQLESWDPTVELQSLDNQAYFADILPRLQTVRVVRNGDLPAVAQLRLNGDYVLSTVGPKLAGQDKWLAAHEATQAFSPEEVPVGPESRDEEALVRSLHLSLIQGALGVASSSFASFEAANQDIVLLLGSLNRPTHRYRHLSDTPQNFMNRHYIAARNSKRFSGEQPKYWRKVTATAVCQAVVDPPSIVRNIAIEETSAIMAPAAIVYQSHSVALANDRLELESLAHETAGGEINFPASPWLKAFLKEFRYDKIKPPENAEEAIQQVDVSESNVVASKFTKELMGRLGIAAYVEKLAEDAGQEEANSSVASALAFITKSEDGVSARIIQLANRVSEMASKTLRENTTSAGGSPVKANQFPQLETLPESLPRAFSVLRLVMTQLGRKPVVESQTTKQLGDVVEIVLATAYPS